MMPSDIKRKLKEAIRRYKTDWRSDVKEVAKFQIDTITKQYPEEAATVKRFEGYRDSKMTKNSLMKFIDSCVGNIARKIEDEFRESDHPRDRGGKFTTKGGEGRGGGKQERSSSRKAPRGRGGVEQAKAKSARINKLIDVAEEGFAQDPDALDQFLEDNNIPKETDYDGEEVNWSELDEDVKLDKVRKFIIEDPDRAQEALGEWGDIEEEDDDDEGYMGISKKQLAEEEEYENARERARREKDNDRVTGPEDRDYMNEEDDDDTTNSAAKDVKSMRQYLDEELFELATTSESEEEFKSKVARRFGQYRWLLKNGQQDELPVGGKRAEYALKKIQSDIDSGTSEYW